MLSKKTSPHTVPPSGSDELPAAPLIPQNSPVPKQKSSPENTPESSESQGKAVPEVLETPEDAEARVTLSARESVLQNQSVYPGDALIPIALRLNPQRYEAQARYLVAKDECETGATVWQGVLRAQIPIEAASETCEIFLEARSANGTLLAQNIFSVDLAPVSVSLNKWCQLAKFLPAVASTLNAIATGVQLRGAESDCFELDAAAATTTDLNLAQASNLDSRVLASFPKLQRLNVAFSGAHNFAALRKLRNLKTLILSGVPLLSLKALPPLFQLQSLDVSQTGLQNLEGIEQFKGLVELRAAQNSLVEVSQLANLTFLRSVSLAHNAALQNISGLEKAVNLQTLDMSNTAITDFGSLARFPLLQNLHLAQTSVLDLHFLSRFPHLRALTLTNTLVSSIEPLANQFKLEVVNIKATKVTDALPLQNLTSLKMVLLDRNNMGSGNCPAHSPSVALNAACVAF